MIEAPLRRFDWFILKPVWVALLGLGLLFVLQAHWFMGIAMLALALCGVGLVGAALHREHTATELAAGYPHRSSIGEYASSSIDKRTSYRLAAAILRLALILAVAAALLALHFGLRWYFAVLIAGAVVGLGPMLLMLPLAAALRPKGQDT